MSWFWAHDAQADQLSALVDTGLGDTGLVDTGLGDMGTGVPGLGLVRLASYGDGPARRFAALLRTGPARTFEVDVPADRIPVDTVAVTGTGPTFTVVREAGRASSVHFGESLPPGNSLPAGRVLDISSSTPTAAYVLAQPPGSGGPPAQQVLAGLDERELRRALRRLDAQPTLVRLGIDGSLTAVAEPGPPTRWAAGIDADEVAHELNRRGAYPLDLDAVRTGAGVRFSVVVRRPD